MNIAPATEKWDAKVTHPQAGVPAIKICLEARDFFLIDQYNKLAQKFGLPYFFIFSLIASLSAPGHAVTQLNFKARLERLQENPGRHCRRPLTDLRKLQIRGARGFTRGLGRSMLPAMKVGALALIWELPAGFRLRRGMVLFFRGDYGNLWIKRLIGLPGDRLTNRQSGSGLEFTLNGKPVRRSQASSRVTLRWIRRDGRGKRLTGPDGAPQVRSETYRLYAETLPNGVSYSILHRPDGTPAAIDRRVTVPPGRLFVMGDNRFRSRDSRHPGYGLVRRRLVVGIALCDVTDKELMAN